VTEIEDFNSDTCGWMGCGDLQIDNYICLTEGSPPMPAPVANAVYGPQVPGTITVPSGVNLSTVNECPLNACCDIWGQCGTTDEFCTITKSPTGAPGTAEEGTNGFISNCGTVIVESDPPASFMKVGYFEGFDQSRSCLNAQVDSIGGSDYIHVVLAFATLTSDF
jgi:chitinase